MNIKNFLRVRCSKIVRIVKEGEAYTPSFIAIMTRPYQADDTGITIWEHIIYINLWALELYFTIRIKDH